MSSEPSSNLPNLKEVEIGKGIKTIPYGAFFMGGKLEKIIIPAAEKYNIPKENIICEDLGWVTDPVKYTMN